MGQYEYVEQKTKEKIFNLLQDVTSIIDEVNKRKDHLEKYTGSDTNEADYSYLQGFMDYSVIEETERNFDPYITERIHNSMDGLDVRYMDNNIRNPHTEHNIRKGYINGFIDCKLLSKITDILSGGLLIDDLDLEEIKDVKEDLH